MSKQVVEKLSTVAFVEAVYVGVIPGVEVGEKLELTVVKKNDNGTAVVVSDKDSSTGVIIQLGTAANAACSYFPAPFKLSGKVEINHFIREGTVTIIETATASGTHATPGKEHACCCCKE